MILVTGSTGFLGSHLLLELTSYNSDCKIFACYRDYSRIKLVERVFKNHHKENFTKYYSKINWIECDLFEVEGLNKIVQKATQVYHCAGFVSFDNAKFESLLKINREATENVVNACLSNPGVKLCHVSSVATIGKKGVNGANLVVESNKWDNADRHSVYAISKNLGEREVWRGVEEGLNAVIINPSVIIGDWDWNESSMKIFKTIDSGLKFFPSGSTGFVDVRDVTKSMVLLMNSTIQSERFICNGENVSFRDFFLLISKEMNTKAPSIKAPDWLINVAYKIVSLTKIFGLKSDFTEEAARSSIQKTIYDNSKIKKAVGLNFTPLKDTIEYAIKGRF